MKTFVKLLLHSTAILCSKALELKIYICVSSRMAPQWYGCVHGQNMRLCHMLYCGRQAIIVASILADLRVT